MPMQNRTHRTRRRRRGFSLPELLISMVMIGIIGVVLTRLVVTQSRFSNKQVLQRNARGVARGALNIMESELRAVEQGTAFNGYSGVAIPAPTTSSITVNVPWAVGVFCTEQRVAILPVDSVQQAIGVAQTVGVAWLDGSDGRYEYMPAPTASNSNDLAACTNAGIDVTSANAMPLMKVVALSEPLSGGIPGTPVMLFYRVKYEFTNSTTVTGRRGLFRSVATSAANFGTAEELVAPFDDNAGFRFFVGTNRTSTSTVPTDLETITGIELLLSAQSERATQGQSNPETANYRTSIFFRNRI
jgi:prepilin-type N-terminal cleavage/methylation domain-containing protein